jgi:hypothetical protein
MFFRDHGGILRFFTMKNNIQAPTENEFFADVRLLTVLIDVAVLSCGFFVASCIRLVPFRITTDIAKNILSFYPFIF